MREILNPRRRAARRNALRRLGHPVPTLRERAGLAILALDAWLGRWMSSRRRGRALQRRELLTAPVAETRIPGDAAHWI